MVRKLTHEELIQKRLKIEEAKVVERHPIYLLIDNVRSLYNVGSIFRTADSGLVKELILCGFTPHPPRKEIEKTALGAIDTVPWVYYKSSIEAVNKLKKEGIKIFALEITDSSKPYTEIKKEDFPLCLVIGNELTGLSNELLNLADEVIEIPMYGVKHSLNVSVATGIALFEAIRIYRKNLEKK